MTAPRRTHLTQNELSDGDADGTATGMVLVQLESNARWYSKLADPNLCFQPCRRVSMSGSSKSDRDASLGL